MEAEHWDRMAGRYEEEITSPFQEGVINPLYDTLRAIPNKRELTVADLGCGIGQLLPFLSKQFGQVIAIDYSRRMLGRAKKRNRAGNIRYHLRDLSDLSPFYGTFDVAVSVNSLLFPSSLSVNRTMTEIHHALRPAGIFAGIFPSMEAMLYQGTLLFHRELDRLGDEGQAMQAAQRLLGRRRLDVVGGIYDRDGIRQKFYYEFELRHRLKRAGFKHLHLKKVLYPWGEDVGSWEEFIGLPRLWDWFVEAVAKA